MKYFFTGILFIFLLTAFAGETRILKEYGTGKNVAYAGKYSAELVRLPVSCREKENEFRGVWVATVEQIDFKYHRTAVSFREDYRKIVKNLKTAGFTDILFQVRPMNDAFYPSELSPFSRWMTGTEGKTFTDEPVFDPLSFMIAEAHRAGLKFHAWLNPYRVANNVTSSKKKYLESLDPKNFARRRPALVLDLPDGKKRNLILNPGEPEVMNYLYRVVGEIVRQYDVDGIHMDDYFYPYSDIGNADDAAWKKYRKKDQSLADWRRSNVDRMISNLHRLLSDYNRKNKKSIQFGVSPFGIWANGKPSDDVLKKSKKPVQYRDEGSLTGGAQSYFKQYADTRKWVLNGWLDYIAPQLYWGFSHNTAAYAALVDWWVETVRGTDVKLYIGHGVYRQGVNPDWENPDELLNQLLYNSQYQEVAGSIFFSYIRIFEPSNEAQKKVAGKIIEKLWHKQYEVKK